MNKSVLACFLLTAIVLSDSTRAMGHESETGISTGKVEMLKPSPILMPSK